MADLAEHRAAFRELGSELRASAMANTRALALHRGTPTGEALDRQLESSLDRLARLYGRGTFENIPTVAIFHSAIETEIAIAHALAEAGGKPVVAASPGRAQNLIDAARRGVRIDVNGALPEHQPFRGAYVEPVTEDLLLFLRERRQPFLRWKSGVLAILQDIDLEYLRAQGLNADILFLDGEELRELDATGNRPALEAEVGRRLAQARLSSDHVGDSRQHYLLRLAEKQNKLLRNLRDRLQSDHPAAHAALLPEIAANRALFETAMMAAPAHRATIGNPLAATIAHERRIRELATKFAAEDDVAGLRGRFSAVAAAPSHLAELERLHR